MAPLLGRSVGVRSNRPHVNTPDVWFDGLECCASTVPHLSALLRLLRQPWRLLAHRSATMTVSEPRWIEEDHNADSYREAARRYRPA